MAAEKQAMKEALAELLNEIPAFRAFKRGKQPATQRERDEEPRQKRPRGGASDLAEAGPSGTAGDSTAGTGGAEEGQPKATGKKKTPC